MVEPPSPRQLHVVDNAEVDHKMPTVAGRNPRYDQIGKGLRV